MHAKLLTLALISTSALAMQGFINQPSFGVMLKRGHAIAKRQGYTPELVDCPGRGNTCAEICGAETVQCPSNNSLKLSCHSSLDGSYCCPDNSGSGLANFPLEMPLANAMFSLLWLGLLLHLQ
jgi:hypothetical protein